MLKYYISALGGRGLGENPTFCLVVMANLWGGVEGEGVIHELKRKTIPFLDISWLWRLSLSPLTTLNSSGKNEECVWYTK